MNATQIVEVLKIVSSLLDLAGQFGIDAAKFTEMKKKAEAEGRDISDDEINALLSDTRNAIEQARQS